MSKDSPPSCCFVAPSFLPFDAPSNDFSSRTNQSRRFPRNVGNEVETLVREAYGAALKNQEEIQKAIALAALGVVNHSEARKNAATGSLDSMSGCSNQGTPRKRKRSLPTPTTPTSPMSSSVSPKRKRCYGRRAKQRSHLPEVRLGDGEAVIDPCWNNPLSSELAVERERGLSEELKSPMSGETTKPEPDSFETEQSIGPVNKCALVFSRLPSNDCPMDEGQNEGPKQTATRPANLSARSDQTFTFQLRHSAANQPRTTNNVHPLIIEGSAPPRPKSTSLIYLNSSLNVDDEPSLSHVPYFGEREVGDGRKEQIALAPDDLALFDTSERNHMSTYGPKFEEDENLEVILTVIRSLESANITGGIRKYMEFLRQVYCVLSELTGVPVDRIQNEHEKHIEGSSSGPRRILTGDVARNAQAALELDSSSSSSSDSDALIHSSQRIQQHQIQGKEFNLTVNSMKKGDETTSYEECLDSYRNLFCRRCFTYDCNVHGVNSTLADVAMQGELALLKEGEGHWDEVDTDIDACIPCNPKPTLSSNVTMDDEEDGNKEDVTLTPTQQTLAERAFLIFRGNKTKIAKSLGAPPGLQAHIECIPAHANKLVTPTFLSSISKDKSQIRYSSMKNYKQKWLRNIQATIIHSQFNPCTTIDPNDETSSCVQGGFFCTKHCTLGAKSKNFFRGCECKAGQCRTLQCPCFASKRECDADICRCCGCGTDPPGITASLSRQRCKNDNISMKRHAHLLVAESTVKGAGWGLFNKWPLKKGDFVHEYVGEIITQEEAERRGVIYDKLKISYLFNLNADYVVDATRKGNKARFANHSETDFNIEPKMIQVNGDMRIGFFATKDVPAQSELFFNYLYNNKIDTDKFYMPDHSSHVDWHRKETQTAAAATGASRHNKGRKK